MTAAIEDAALLAAELLARRWLPRNHPRVRRALVDAELWADVGQRLAGVGLRLVDNLYADHVSVALLRPAESTVFGDTGLAGNNNLELPRDGVALLVVLWSLIVLPKRERQASRVSAAEPGQDEMFPSGKPLPTAQSVSPTVSYAALLADFGVQLGKKTRLDMNLKALERHGFIERRGNDIAEGPLLDLLLDYDTLAPRILDGALADVLVRERAAPAEPEAADAEAVRPAPVALPVAAEAGHDAPADDIAREVEPEVEPEIGPEVRLEAEPPAAPSNTEPS